MTVHAVAATAADIADLVALVQSAYRGDASRQGWTTEADFLEGQRLDPEVAAEMIADPAGVVLLSRDGQGRAVASVQLRDLGTDESGRRRAYFGLFAVSPASQGTGLGSALMVRAEKYVRSTWGAELMQMTVISLRTDLISYYLRRGYRQTGQTEPFPYGDERFGIPQRADLEFALLLKDLSALEPAPADSRV